MSLLRDVLRKRSETSGFEPPKALTSRRGMKEYASSVLSSGSTIRSVRSIAESVASFYSFVSGGSRIPKRRRADISRLGLGKFYRKNPKPAIDMPGVKYLDSSHLGPYTCAHAKSFGKEDDPDAPYWGSIILFSHATTEQSRALYHARAQIMGEVRIHLTGPTNIQSIDVWLVAKNECILDLNQKPFLNAVAHVWTRETGDPTKLPAPGKKITIPFKGKFPAGTYVFPFEFPALPRDAPEFQMDVKVTAPKHIRMHLPCTHEFSMTTGWVGWTGYAIGVNIKKESSLEKNAEWTMPFEYFPRCRPILAPETHFPFIATRDDWPFKREEVGGWTLTPFGGRGRWKDEIIEVEGLLGVQAPTVYSAGMKVKFGLLLWCTNEEALDALSRPEAFQVDFLRADIFGLDVLDPHNSARRNRHLTRIGEAGRVWRTDVGPPAEDAPAVAPLVPREGAVRKGMTHEDYVRWGKTASVTTITQSGLGGTRAMEFANEAHVAETAVKLGELTKRRTERLGLATVSTAPTPSRPSLTSGSASLRGLSVTSLPLVDDKSSDSGSHKSVLHLAAVIEDSGLPTAESAPAEPAAEPVSPQAPSIALSEADALKNEWLSRASSPAAPSFSSGAPLVHIAAAFDSQSVQSDFTEALSPDLLSPVSMEEEPVTGFADLNLATLPTLRRDDTDFSLSEMPTLLRNDTIPFNGDDDDTSELGKARAPSPTPSFEDDSKASGANETDAEPVHTMRMDGDLLVPQETKPPSYRWKYQGLEYILHVLIQHPDYSHISPGRQSGLVAETPLWIVTDEPKVDDTSDALWSRPKDLVSMSKVGVAIPAPAGAHHRLPDVTGNATEERRPAWLGVRTWAFL